jgi:hypothetical protein
MVLRVSSKSQCSNKLLQSIVTYAHKVHPTTEYTEHESLRGSHCQLQLSTRYLYETLPDFVKQTIPTIHPRVFPCLSCETKNAERECNIFSNRFPGKKVRLLKDKPIFSWFFGIFPSSLPDFHQINGTRMSA